MKLRVMINGLGMPVEFKLTPGQAADIGIPQEKWTRG